MKPDTFDSKPSTFPDTSLSSQSFYHVPHLLIYRKTQKLI